MKEDLRVMLVMRENRKTSLFLCLGQIKNGIYAWLTDDGEIIDGTSPWQYKNMGMRFIQDDEK